ncbi:Transcriptional regulator, LysR family [Candidatus Burkholderia humilis]|nr:Transcriptional regulator, LysR family [Candidatus Burkholderia humilis]
MALCRQEDPEIAIHFSEVPLAQQIRGLHDDLYDVGFAQSNHTGDGILVEPAWSDPLRVAIPARHPLLAHARIPLNKLLRYPLVTCDAHLFEGYHQQIERVLRSVHAEPLIAERVSSFDLVMAIVSAGFALALVGASHIGGTRAPDVVGRPIANHDAVLTTYVLRRDADPTNVVSRFIERVAALETDPVTPPMTASPHDTDKETSL